MLAALSIALTFIVLILQKIFIKKNKKLDKINDKIAYMGGICIGLLILNGILVVVYMVISKSI
ncbi:MAG: hypothetical protein IPJ81_06745 [Chitinophagaceae bacterium]|nr:hypothetical protein [Chitinophagaceae bacterium]